MYRTASTAATMESIALVEADRVGENEMEPKPPLEPELVQEFVGKAHGDLARVKELLEREPALVNACWDWGGGDWETGLGATAHMGRRDIAEHLLGQGARLDLFAAAMLGKLAVVQAILEDDPRALHARGPHGIPLLAHAEAGGAAEVIAFLKSVDG